MIVGDFQVTGHISRLNFRNNFALLVAHLFASSPRSQLGGCHNSMCLRPSSGNTRSAQYLQSVFPLGDLNNKSLCMSVWREMEDKLNISQFNTAIYKVVSVVSTFSPGAKF